MRRRRLLVLAALAGCAGQPVASSGTRRVPAGRTVTVDDTRLAVRNPRVTKSVATTGVAHTHVVAGAGQFVVADVVVDDAPADGPNDLRPVVDGDSRPEESVHPVAATPGAFAFPFPTGRHDTAAVCRGEQVCWTLPRDVRRALALEPRFVVSALRLSRRDGRRVLELHVANDGERDDTFRARVSLASFSGGHVVELPVPARESRTYVGRAGSIVEYLENQGGGTVTVQYPGTDGLVRVERQIETETAEA